MSEAELPKGMAIVDRVTHVTLTTSRSGRWTVGEHHPLGTIGGDA